MYVQQSIGSLALQDAKQLVNFAANRAEYSAELLREKANSDLFYAQAELEKDGQDFMRSLQQRSDYDNFSSLADDFLNKKKDVLTKNAQNAYTAKLYDKMLTSYRNNLMNNIENQKLKMYVDDMNAQDAATVKKNSEIYSGQALINQNIKVFATQYADGRISAQEQLSKTINASTEAIYADKVNGAKADIQSFIASGKSYKDFEKNFNETYGSKEYKVKILDAEYASKEGLEEALREGKGFTDISESIDNKGINKKALSALETEWNKQLKTYQDKNNIDILNSFQTEFDSTNSDMIREDIKAKYLKRVQNLKKTQSNIFSDVDYYQLQVRFAPDEEKAKIKGSSSSAKQTDANIKEIEAELVAAVQYGNNSKYPGIRTGYGALNYFINFCKGAWQDDGLSEDQIKLKLDEKIDSFNKALATAYKNNGSLGQAIGRLNDWQVALTKKYPNYFSTDELKKLTEELLFDTLMDRDVTNPEEQNAAVERIKAIIYENGMEHYVLNKKGKKSGSDFVERHLDKNGNVKDNWNVVLEGTADLSGANVSKENKGKSQIVWTDRRGVQRLSPYAQEAIETLYDPCAKEALSMFLGTGPENFTALFENNDENDVTGRRIYVDNKTKKSYVFEVTPDQKSFVIKDAKTGMQWMDMERLKEMEKSKAKKLSKDDAEKLKAEKAEKNLLMRKQWVIDRAKQDEWPEDVLQQRLAEIEEYNNKNKK